MKIVILGAGFAGLTAAYELNKAGKDVLVLEKSAQPGGAAGGFKRPNWDWYLDFAYHHWFTNDYDILNLCRSIGFTNVLVKRPETATLYDSPLSSGERESALFTKLLGTNNRIYKLDSPLDLLKFDRLSMAERLRTGIALAALKFGPELPFYDTMTAKELLIRTMGERAYKTLWQPLFAKKFGEHAGHINASFFWARISKRTPSLAYPSGGFQELANYFGAYLEKQGVRFEYNTEVKLVALSKPGFTLKTEKNTLRADRVINTLPSPLYLKIGANTLPPSYVSRLSKIQYLGAQTIVIETTKRILDSTYWLNIAKKSNPWMVAVAHTNFMNSSHYGNNHLLYLATYTNTPLAPPNLDNEPDVVWHKNVVIPLAQPLYTTQFAQHMPHFATPTPGLYFANMELTYPYDRGTNYAVRVGRTAAKALIKDSAPPLVIK